MSRKFECEIRISSLAGADTEASCTIQVPSDLNKVVVWVETNPTGYNFLQASPVGSEGYEQAPVSCQLKNLLQRLLRKVALVLGDAIKQIARNT